VLATIVTVMLSGFVTGALARFAVPGPDPMPVWLTMAIGLAGSGLGWLIVTPAIGSDNLTAISIGGFITAVVLVVAYRRFVQKRPLAGPRAMDFPERGIGVAEQREKLRRLGLRLVATQRPAPVAAVSDHDTDDLLVKLNELHKAGVLTDEEYRAKRELVLEREP
jgi:uncharacterized membrane protein YeaQ/YmgE (transglycosylase-associated protein family)